ncbi:uncharacterized protein PHALS_13760 [Plasmopara halstedii]|uniref:ELMO domain-containing protein n=1 Tax=Plasmopara halstedii TaxID=4781 RepID=A0A0P1AQ50_PLAHL|nr:uncharacterized protein PHALS_13760 [Plasmopara halstedii]CEG43568.1 hypothetical protein PHALS_13760 [Plasmopara halstedii]|eukprot:XP_024579937.1 hypothetical protein PHALS_13760 [Plasmopara halstedii]
MGNASGRQLTCFISTPCSISRASAIVTAILDRNLSSQVSNARFCAGELGLRCLVFFVETYPAESAMMRRGRGGYHFVKAAIAVVRILSLRLHLMDTVGNPGPFPVTCTLYWQLIKHETEFFHFFSLAFLVFEELFCEEVATNLWMKDMDTCSMAVMDKLVGAVDLKLENELKKAPLELADLQDLCSNGRYIVDKMNENRRAADIDKKTFKDGESGLVSRWSQHQNPKRKTLQEIGRTWGKEEKDECYKNNVYRLKPRMPEIERHHSDNLQVSGTTSDAKVSPRRSKAVEIDKIDPLEQTAIDSSHDLFAGLTTKTKLALDESKNIENVASLELAPVA